MVTGPHAPHDADDRAARARRDAREARAEVAAITKRVHAAYPEDYDAASGYKVTVTPFKEILGQKASSTLWLLMGAAAFVLIIACANVTNLTLMRGVRREHELTVRAALGAGTHGFGACCSPRTSCSPRPARARTGHRVRRRANALDSRGTLQHAGR